MSGVQTVINGLPQNLANSLMQSLVILSSGLDQNASTTLNNIDIQNISNGGNIKIGEAAMSNSVNAPQTNIAIGYQSLLVVDGSTLDSDNIAIGKQALYNATTGGKNIGIGLNALSGLTTKTNTIGIGNNTQSTASNGIIIGNNAVLTTNNSGMLKFNSAINNTSYPATNEFWFGDPLNGWIDVKAGNIYVDTLDVSGALTTGFLSLSSLQVASDTGKIDITVRNSNYNNSLNKIDEIQNTASFRNKYGPIAFIADVSGVSSSTTAPILREKILFGYQQGTKAIEINTYGAISLDSVNSGNALPALTSNYGNSGQVIMSQGASSNTKWSTITDIPGVIGLNNKNLQGITFVKDISGNLDSSSNFIYDGFGINISSSKNSSLNGIQIQNSLYGNLATTNVVIKNDTYDAKLELKSSGYTNGLSIDATANMLSITNAGSISTNSGNKTLIGYSSNTKAIEINNLGAISFDTYNNTITYISNYGTTGQVIMSQGSSTNPKWSSVSDISGVITTFSRNIRGIAYIKDTSGNLDSTSNFIYDGSGLITINATEAVGAMYPKAQINIDGSANSNIWGLQISNLNPGNTSSSDIKFYNNTASFARISYRSSTYGIGTGANYIGFYPNVLTFVNAGPIVLTSSSNILFGYSGSTKAIEINSSGAISFDTSNNNGTYISNYGTIGQILSSQGSTTPPKWITNTGGITIANANINGISYVKDTSGNLDSSSNFIYDGSGINISASKNSQLYGLSIQNTSTSGSARSNLTLKNSVNTATLELKSSGYTAGSTIDASANMLTIANNGGSISINSGDKTLFGYSANTKAIEINSSGAMSFNTYNNTGTFTSNYGTAGQIMVSQGSSSAPQWSNATYTGFPKIIYTASANFVIAKLDTSGTLFSYNIGSGLTSGKTRLITFSISSKVIAAFSGSSTILTYTLYINGISQQSFNRYMPLNIMNSTIQHTLMYQYSNSNTSENIDIKFNSYDNNMYYGTSDLYIFRMEEIQ